MTFARVRLVSGIAIATIAFALQASAQQSQPAGTAAPSASQQDKLAPPSQSGAPAAAADTQAPAGNAPAASPREEAPSAAPDSGTPQAATPAPSPMIDRINNAGLTDTKGKDGVDPAILRAQVMLDRVHISPGVIDGHGGENTEHALQTYETIKQLKTSKALDKQVWESLLKDAGGPVLQGYTLTDDDVAGPFYPDLPTDYAKLAKLKAMGFRSARQKIAEKFHMDEDLLATLNPSVDLTKAGTRIVATKVDQEPIHGEVHRIIVDKDKSEVFGFDAKGKVMVAFPATIGSEELPSPSGTYKVKGVAWNPIYYYNPKNFVQDDHHEKLQLPPGPNNPVGSVFIALTKPTYGLHGTPDASKIDKSHSHGCVRMTNWDATELAHLVKPGIVVHFKK